MELRREDKLLLGCLKGKGDQLKDSGLERLRASDWDGVVQRSIRHSVANLLYMRLCRLDLHLPGAVLERLRDIYLATLVRNMILYHELSKRLKILREERIPVILLKGGHLGEGVYGDVGLRSMADVDLLLRREDLARGQKRLLDAGYSPFSREISLDLHTNIEPLVDHLKVDIEGVWQRARPVVIDGMEVLTLSPEDLLLHLCIHLSFHHLYRGAGVRTLCDIRQTVEHYGRQIDWEKVQYLAIQWDAANSVYLTLLLAEELLEAGAPDTIVEGLKPESYDPQMKIWALEQIFHPDSEAIHMSIYFWQLWKPGPLREKASNLRKLFFPPAEIISEKYAAPFRSVRNYLYYLVRFKDHFIRYAFTTWRVLIRDERMVALIEQKNRDLFMRRWLASNQ